MPALPPQQAPWYVSKTPTIKKTPMEDYYTRQVAVNRIAQPALSPWSTLQQAPWWPQIRNYLTPQNNVPLPWYYKPVSKTKKDTEARLATERAQTLAAKPKTTAPMEDFYTRAVAQNRIVPTRTSMEDFYQRAAANQRVVRRTPPAWEDYYQRAIGANRPLAELMPAPTQIAQPPEGNLSDYWFRALLAGALMNYGGATTPKAGTVGGGGGYAVPAGGGGGGDSAYLPNWMTGLFQLNANR